jgi:hypothetical protein
MTVFRKVDLKALFYSPDFDRCNYYYPNMFEAWWGRFMNNDSIGLCYEKSKIVNIPLNLVQENKTHRAMNLLTPKELLEEFNLGLRIDIDRFFGCTPTAPHMEYIPTLK